MGRTGGTKKARAAARNAGCEVLKQLLEAPLSDLPLVTQTVTADLGTHVVLTRETYDALVSECLNSLSYKRGMVHGLKILCDQLGAETE